ncbi:MAG: GIY-YIG nuclease family protein [Symbiobacteriia bacterium]
MDLFQVRSMLDLAVKPIQCKLHFAVNNGEDEPLDVYRDGRFDEWQRWQSRRNFKRPYVISLIAMQSSRQWLFAGVHQSLGYEERGGQYYYNLARLPQFNELDGRLVITFEKDSRPCYRNAETLAERLDLAEIRSEKLGIMRFPGFANVRLQKHELEIIVRHQEESWRAALSAVAGVYVIADTRTGRLYVGSATGSEGLWDRWCQYANNGHGQNEDLKAVLDREGSEYANNFQFGILEIAGSQASRDEIRDRESHWKELLLSRDFGYNLN